MKKILIALQLLGLYTFGQNVTTVYIDPDFTGNGNGTISQPYNDWDNDIVISDNTIYLQKRGTEITNLSPITIENKENVTFGAYGEGERPKIIYFGNNNAVINIMASSGCKIKDLEIEGNIEGTLAGVHIGGYYGGNRPANNNEVTNCVIHDVYNGVRGLPYSTNIDSVRIWNSTIYNCMSDGIFVISADSVSIINTHVYNVNMAWHLKENGHSQYVSEGDCIQLGGDCNSFLVKNCLLDRRFTGNKFCFIYNTGGDLHTGSGEISNTIFYPPKDTLDDDGGSCLYLKFGSYIKIHHNRFYGQGYPDGEKPGNLAHFEIDTIDFYYNLIDEVPFLHIGMPTDLTRVINNTFVQTNGTDQMIKLNGQSCIARNNIFALTPGMVAIKNNSGGLVNQTNIISFENFGNIPGFTNFNIGDYTLKPTSPCVDSGTDYQGWPYDLDGNPMQNTRDIGAFEFNDGSQSLNEPPVINNQSFSIPENSPQGAIAGIVIATDPNSGQSLTYVISSGNIDNIFEINPNTGQISVAVNNGLNFENINLYNLLIEVTDNDPIPLTASAIVNILLLDVNEPPDIPDQDFTISENAPNGAWVGNIMAMDPDAGQEVTFALQSGNLGSVFELNETTGLLSVADNIFLDYEALPVFNLIIEVTDNSPQQLSTINNLIIQLIDINDAPLIFPNSFSINENSANGSSIGIVSAYDQDEGQLLNFSIAGGNLGSTFSINSASGEILVYDNVFLNFETIPYFDLLVRVQDNGAGSLYAEAMMHISLGDINDPPIIVNQQFTVAENSPAGFFIGDVFAYDPDVSDQPHFTILSGNLGGTFSLNSLNGILSVNDNAFLNFEAIPFFELLVKVEDSEMMASYASLFISVIDINDPPIIFSQNFSVLEYSPNGYSFGSVLAYDPDPWQTINFELLSGNLGGTFQINATTGKLSVFDNVFLDPDLIPFFDLIVKVSDNGLLNLSNQAIVHIEVLDGNGQTLQVNGGDATTDSESQTAVEELMSVNDLESNREDKFQLYPNPTSDWVFVHPTDIIFNNIQIRILDLSGKIHFEKQLSFGNNISPYRLELPNFPHGIFIVHLFNDSFNQTEKLIIK